MAINFLSSTVRSIVNLLTNITYDAEGDGYDDYR